MTPELIAISGLCAAVAFGCGCFVLGYNRGIRDTERRWSEIVAKANYERDMSKSR